MDTDDLITPPEAARRLGIGRTSVYHLTINGTLAPVKIGGRMFFRATEVNRLAAFGPRRPGRPRKPSADAPAPEGGSEHADQ